jgi:hypothetical protein
MAALTVNPTYGGGPVGMVAIHDWREPLGLEDISLLRSENSTIGRQVDFLGERGRREFC